MKQTEVKAEVGRPSSWEGPQELSQARESGDVGVRGAGVRRGERMGKAWRGGGSRIGIWGGHGWVGE